MANTKSAAKRAPTSDPNGVYALISALDKAAKRGIIHRNAANRRKARLNRGLTGVAKA
jgi:ribosomal protein S20